MRFLRKPECRHFASSAVEAGVVCLMATAAAADPFGGDPGFGEVLDALVAEYGEQSFSEVVTAAKSDETHPLRRALAALVREGNEPTDVVGRLLTEEEPRLRIGFRWDTPPFSSGPNGFYSYNRREDRIDGFAIEVCAEVEHQIRRALEAHLAQMGLVRKLQDAYYKAVQRDEVVSSVEAGDVDFVCGPVTVTRERMARVGFSRPFFATGAVAVVKLDEPRKDRVFSLSELAKRRVGVMHGSSSEAVLKSRELLPIGDCSDQKRESCIEAIDGYRQGIHKLRRDDINVLVGDREIVLHHLREIGINWEQYARSEPFTFEPYAIPMRRGDHRLKCLVDWALSGLFENFKKENSKDNLLGPALDRLFDRTGMSFEDLPLLLQSLYAVGEIPSTGSDTNGRICIAPS